VVGLLHLRRIIVSSDSQARFGVVTAIRRDGPGRQKPSPLQPKYGGCRNQVIRKRVLDTRGMR
jgi:hypothetical protein